MYWRSVSFCLGATLLVAAQLLTAQSRPLSGADASELAAGKRIFDAQCAWCHGTDGSGGAGPSLQRSDLRHASTDADLTSILNGIAGTEMPGLQWALTDTMTWRTAAYVRSLGRRPAEQLRGDPTRKGDNLYTCSLVALDVDSGTMRWHFQFTPHDVHDWDANQIPVLVDRTIDGRATARVAMTNRNGFFYLLDRRSGEFLLARQYAKQTWAEAIDPRGRPIVIPGMEPSEKGTLVYPSLQGATNWASPSFSPLTGLMYVAVREMGSVYFKSDVEYRPGTYYTGGSEKRLDDESWGSIRALNIDTGATVWDFKLPSPPWGGVLSTAGVLVFPGSNEGNVFALDAKTGDPLWQFQAGGPMRANPMSFSVKGRQHLAVAAGRAYVVFALPVQ